jgi:hypothetical protein
MSRAGFARSQYDRSNHRQPERQERGKRGASIEIAGIRVPATASLTPLYDPGNARILG